MQVFNFFTIIKFRAINFSTSLGHYRSLINKVELTGNMNCFFSFCRTWSHLAGKVLFRKVGTEFLPKRSIKLKSKKLEVGGKTNVNNLIQ
jgi:hypothetical protein